MAHLRDVHRRFKNGFRENGIAVMKKKNARTTRTKKTEAAKATQA